jgi:hypothetical protein
MDCSIVRLETGSAVHLLGRVRSDIATHIHYCLTIERSGRTSDTTLAEIGDVDIPANVPVDFGHIRLPLRASAELEAHLIVSWEQGSIECDLIPKEAPRDRHSR